MIAGLPGQASPRWFDRLGAPLAPGEREAARSYLAALGLDVLEVAVAAGWPQAEAIARDPGWDARWWAREEAERERLHAVCVARLGRDQTLARLSAATELAAHAIHQVALRAAGAAGVDLDAAPRAASGAATMALHASALARLAGEGSAHPFMRKYALFESGRWPLAVVRDRFYLF